MGYNIATPAPGFTFNGETGIIESKDIYNPLLLTSATNEKWGAHRDGLDFSSRPLNPRLDISSILDDVRDISFESDMPMEIVNRYRTKFIKSGGVSRLHLEVARCIFKIYTWYQTVGHLNPVVKPEEYLLNSLVHKCAFSRYIKKVRCYATEISLSHEVFRDAREKVAEINECTDFFKRDILDLEGTYNYDDFLHEQYLIFWEETDILDSEWAFKAPKFEERFLDHFEESLINLLRIYPTEGMIRPSEDDISTWVSDSSTHEGITHRTKIRSQISSEAPFGKLTDNLRFKRQIIPVSPANFRDSWMSDIDTLFTIKSISFLSRQIVDNLPGSAMYSVHKVHKRKSLLRTRKKDFYFMLDFKKSGLTIPHEILERVSSALCKVYPDNEDIFSKISKFKNCKVNFDGIDRTPLRGCGLGNLNEIYTLIQCVFGFVFKNKFDLRSIFFNDDATYELPGAYQRKVGFLCSYIEKCGFTINYAKSFVSEHNVFCEEYKTFEDNLDYRKKQLLILPMCEAIFKNSIVSSKELIHSMDRLQVGTGLRTARSFMNLAIQCYGTEFGLMDPHLPYEFGGWLHLSETNFSPLIDYICDPRKYLPDNKQGHIPTIRRWIEYNLERNVAYNDGILNSKVRSRIPYSERITNPIVDRFTLNIFSPSKMEEEYTRYYDLDHRNLFSDFDDILNYRGLHNSKPKLKLGLEMKRLNYRKKVFRMFRHYKSKLGYCCDLSSVRRSLLAIRGIENKPDKLMYPGFLVFGVIERAFCSKKKTLIVRKHGDSYSGISTRRTVDRSISSLSGGHWIKKSHPFIFSHLWKKMKTGYIISDKDLYIDNQGWVTPPIGFEAFCPNKRLFMTELMTRFQGFPACHGLKDLEGIKICKDIFLEILPDALKHRYKNIVRSSLSRKRIADCLYQFNIGKDKFGAALSALERLVEYPLPVKREEVIYDVELEFDADIDLVVSRFRDQQGNIEDLIDDFSDSSSVYHFSDIDDNEFMDTYMSDGLDETRRIFRYLPDHDGDILN